MWRHVSRRRPLVPVELWDGRVWLCYGFDDGFPVFGFRFAPSGLSTRRQLRAEGLCPGGYRPYGLVSWRPRPGRRGWAYLYRRDLARAKRVPSPAQLAALDRALAARQARESCWVCCAHVGYRIDPVLGSCYACADRASSHPDAPAAGSTGTCNNDGGLDETSYGEVPA